MATEFPMPDMWFPSQAPPAFDPAGLTAAATRIREPAHVLRDEASGRLGVGFGGELREGTGPFRRIGTLPPLYPEWLGDRAFTETHGLRFPYVAGEMANGIATSRLVIAMARAGMLGFFGAAGLPLAKVEQGLDEIEAALGTGDAAPAWGTNLIHSPSDLALENAVAELYVRRGVRRICVSAFMGLTAAVVRCAATGLRRTSDGAVLRRHHLFAKISRPEVAEAFMSPAPRALLQSLVRAGQLTADEAALAERVPLAEDVTVEADSGGHTDNRPLTALLPSILALRDTLQARHGGSLRVGAAGGLGTPGAVAAAFSLGAAYVVTGSVNQGAVESGLSEDGRRLLAEAGLADVIMAPAADMFELGVKVQVLRKGTLFGIRAAKLYETYRAYDSLEAIPEDARVRLEREVLGAPCAEIWSEVQRFFATRDPAQLAQAEREPKHRMALVFRWYLGLSSKWAIAGEAARKLDFQIWCGPAMGAFNQWAKGSFLEKPEARSAVQIARNFLEGAAVIARAQQLRSAGVPMPASAFTFAPRPLA
jgi:PfaD family protein